MSGLDEGPGRAFPGLRQVQDESGDLLVTRSGGSEVESGHLARKTCAENVENSETENGKQSTKSLPKSSKSINLARHVGMSSISRAGSLENCKSLS